MPHLIRTAAPVLVLRPRVTSAQARYRERETIARNLATLRLTEPPPNPIPRPPCEICGGPCRMFRGVPC